MRLFFDSNVMTYIAVFEAFLVEGTAAELRGCVELWEHLQGSRPEAALRREIEALRILYLVDDQAHFDWLFSDLAVDEIMNITRTTKRDAHAPLLRRLLEHRAAVYAENDALAGAAEIDSRKRMLFPTLSADMEGDAAQFSEADLLEACYFVTNDKAFRAVANRSSTSLRALAPSALPFVVQHLDGSVVGMWPNP